MTDAYTRGAEEGTASINRSSENYKAGFRDGAKANSVTEPSEEWINRMFAELRNDDLLTLRHCVTHVISEYRKLAAGAGGETALTVAASKSSPAASDSEREKLSHIVHALLKRETHQKTLNIEDAIMECYDSIKGGK